MLFLCRAILRKKEKEEEEGKKGISSDWK